MIASHTTNIQIYPPDPFYLFTSLSIYYWTGIFVLLAVMVLRLLVNTCMTKALQLIDVMTLGLLTLYFSVVTFIYPTIRYVDSYNFYWNLLHPIISAGTTDICIDYSPMYHTIFNGATIFLSYLFQLNISPHLISNSFPILVIFSGSLFTYVLSSRISDNYPLIGGIVFIIFNWDACHMAPQHFVYIISFCILCLVLYLFDDIQNRRTHVLLLIICLTTTMFSHLLTCIIILYFLIFLFAVLTVVEFRFRHFASIQTFMSQLRKYAATKSLLLWPILYLGVAFLSYLLHNSVHYFAKLVSFSSNIYRSFVENDGIVLVHRTVVDVVPSDSYIMVYELRMGILCLYLFLAIVFSLLILNDCNRKTEKSWACSYSILTILVFVSLFLFGGILLAFGNAVYGFERSYPLSLIPFGILASIAFGLKTPSEWLMKLNKIITISVIVVIILLLPVAKYGSDPYHFFSESEDKANQFGRNHVENFDLTLYEEGTFSNMMYNNKVLKEQSGREYKSQFMIEGVNKIYDVGGTSQIFKDAIVPL